MNTNSMLHFPFEVKLLNADAGTFEGYASTYSLDLQNDKILPGAFQETIKAAQKRRDARNGDILVPLLYMHDPSVPIGGLYSMEEDGKGLFVKGFIDLDVAKGREAFSGL